MRNNKRNILAVGEEAKKMIGRTPGNIIAVRPLKDGVIADFATTEIMLKYFIRKTAPQGIFLRRSPKLVICVPCSITKVERRAVEEAIASSKRKFVLYRPRPKDLGIVV